MPVWPSVNYASKVRGFDGDHKVIVQQPRPRYTWFVQFYIANDAQGTVINEAHRNGRLLAATKSIGIPDVEFEVEKLRSYNNWRNVPTVAKYKPITMRFHDDAAAHIAQLIKSYRSFYHYGADARSYTQFGGGVGESARPPGLPSMGMKIRSGSRNFFDAIRIFDLGTDPHSVNVYTLVNPIVSNFEHGDLDYTDGTGLGEVSLTIEYEGYVDAVKQEVTSFAGVFEQIGEDSSSLLDADVLSGLGLGDLEREGFFDGFIGQLGENISEVAFEAAVEAAVGLASGDFNSENFKRDYFRKVAKGTPIQDIRNVVRDVRRVDQRIGRGDGKGAVEGARRILDTVGGLGRQVYENRSPRQALYEGQDGKPTPTSNHAAAGAESFIREILLGE